MKCFFTPEGLKTRHWIEYSSHLRWAAPKSIRKLLDAIQKRAILLIDKPEINSLPQVSDCFIRISMANFPKEMLISFSCYLEYLKLYLCKVELKWTNGEKVVTAYFVHNYQNFDFLSSLKKIFRTPGTKKCNERFYKYIHLWKKKTLQMLSFDSWKLLINKFKWIYIYVILVYYTSNVLEDKE